MCVAVWLSPGFEPIRSPKASAIVSNCIFIVCLLFLSSRDSTYGTPTITIVPTVEETTRRTMIAAITGVAALTSFLRVFRNLNAPLPP